MRPAAQTTVTLALLTALAGCPALGQLDSQYDAGTADQHAPDGAPLADGSKHDAGHDAARDADATVVDAAKDTGEFSGSCATSPVFADDFSAPSAPGAGYTTIPQPWFRAPGTFTATWPPGPGQDRAYALIGGSYVDFDVTIEAHSIGGDGFGLVYATSGIGDGYAILVHPNEYHGIYFKRLIPNDNDDNISSVVLPVIDPSSPFTLHVQRTSAQVSITLTSPALPAQVTLTGVEDGAPTVGRLGLIMSPTDQVSTNLEGAVFTDFVVRTATCASTSDTDAGDDAADAGSPDTGALAVVPYSNGSGAPGPGGTNADGHAWTMIFDDEFDGSSLDSSKWAPGWYASDPATSITDPVNPSAACLNPANVSVVGGSLRLAMTSGSCTSESGMSYSYATGQVTTAPSGGTAGTLFDYLHGYMEARVFLPGSGSIDNWPAFWATGVVTGTPNTWPATGEIDVMEGLGGGSYGHWHGPTPGSPGTDDSFGVSPASPSSFTGWHVYGATWTPSGITWYYDGVDIGSGTPAQATSTPMYILLGNQANTSGPATPGIEQVDYVRVWQ
jgi:beta-glucanase (GH16 family)